MPPSLKYEKKLWKKGIKLIAGIDEAGVGPLAGPVVAAAIILPQGFKLNGINDSKKLSSKKRDLLFTYIMKNALAVGIGIIEHKIIDIINIFEASKLAMQEAINNLETSPSYLLIDGKRNKLPIPLPQQCINSGDKTCASISAASIIAKVTRDRIMLKLNNKYPKYGFARHKGYGTREHYRKLKKHGPCPIHRLSFNLTAS